MNNIDKNFQILVDFCHLIAIKSSYKDINNKYLEIVKLDNEDYIAAALNMLGYKIEEE
jgi:regulator of sigma D